MACPRWHRQRKLFKRGLLIGFMVNENYTSQSEQQRPSNGPNNQYEPIVSGGFGLDAAQRREMAELFDWAEESLGFDIVLSKPLAAQLKRQRNS